MLDRITIQQNERKAPLISVIVPIYKVELYLSKCLDSIVGQTYRNLEIILVDDGSPDNCGAICDMYAARDNRITVLHQENRGVAAARNAGLAAAFGEWIGWVDPDDIIELDMYEYLLTCALAHNADIAVCGIRTMINGQEVPRWISARKKMVLLDREKAVEQYLSGELHYGCVNKLSRRSLWEGLYFPDYQMAEDLSVMWRLFERVEKVVHLGMKKYIRCRRDGSITTSKKAKTRLDEYRAAKECFDNMVSRWPQFESLLARRCVESASGLWCGYRRFSPEERRGIRPQLRSISDFCRPYIPNALAHTGMGYTGRLALRLVAWPNGWALTLAGLANWLYQRKHRWSL